MLLANRPEADSTPRAVGAVDSSLRISEPIAPHATQPPLQPALCLSESHQPVAAESCSSVSAYESPGSAEGTNGGEDDAASDAK